PNSASVLAAVTVDIGRLPDVCRMKFRSLTACSLFGVAENQFASARSRNSSSFRIIGIAEFGVEERHRDGSGYLCEKAAVQQRAGVLDLGTVLDHGMGQLDRRRRIL